MGCLISSAEVKTDIETSRGGEGLRTTSGGKRRAAMLCDYDGEGEMDQRGQQEKMSREQERGRWGKVNLSAGLKRRRACGQSSKSVALER